MAGIIKYVLADERHEAAHSLSVGAMAARGDPKELKKLLKEWSREN